MPRKRGRQAKRGTDLSNPPTTPPYARIPAASLPATPAPERTKTVTRVRGGGWGIVEEVEGHETQDEIDKEWMEILAKEPKMKEVAQHNVLVFGEEMDRMEVKWEAKLKVANEEIARLQQEIKEETETLGMTIEKSVTIGLEVKERGKEIATLRKVVATLKKEREVKTVVKEVGVQVIAPTMTVENRGIQVEQCTYTDVLAQTEVMISVVATTDKMDIDELTTTIMPAGPPAAKTNCCPYQSFPQGHSWYMA